ncbi:MAG: hypothetical protein ABIO70_32170, partial [Pseudomonadota bacterium]
MAPQGTRIGPYALEAQIGRAEGCTVWQAVRADGKARGPSKVWVRLLDDPGDPAAQVRLEAEYRRLKALDGAGAPKAWAHYAGLGALVFEPRRGATVRALLDAAQAATLELDEATAIEIGLGVARVLRHAHQLQEPVVSGRLCPAEILLGQDGSVTLTGWGGWGLHPWPEGLAPELRRGAPATPTSDQFALGTLLTTLLEPRLVQAQGIAAAVERIGRRWPACGRMLETSLAQDPAGRYPEVGQVIHELLSLTRQEGGVARIGELVERCSTVRRGGAAVRAMLSSLSAPLALPPAPIPAMVPPPAVAPPPAEVPTPRQMPGDEPSPFPAEPPAEPRPVAPCAAPPEPAPGVQPVAEPE